MKLKQLAVSMLCVFGSLAVQAGELSPEVTAKFLKVIVSTSGQGKIACSDSTMKSALEAQGISVDSSSPVVWCTNPTEAKMQRAMGKLVVVGRRDLGAMACIVIAEDSGRPKLVLNTNNLRSSKVTLSDAIMKIGEKL